MWISCISTHNGGYFIRSGFIPPLTNGFFFAYVYVCVCVFVFFLRIYYSMFSFYSNVYVLLYSILLQMTYNTHFDFFCLFDAFRFNKNMSCIILFFFFAFVYSLVWYVCVCVCERAFRSSYMRKYIGYYGGKIRQHWC